MKKLAEFDHLFFHVPPACQGQIVEYAYAIDAEMGLVRRITNRSDKSLEFAYIPWDDLDGEAVIEPWNEEPELTGWVSLAVDTGFDAEAARLVDFGNVEDYFEDDEAERHRRDWESSRDDWEMYQDAAIYEREAGRFVLCLRALRRARDIEDEWGDWPATRRLAQALGIPEEYLHC
jgi:hypothetical protein